MSYVLGVIKDFCGKGWTSTVVFEDRVLRLCSN